MSLPALILASLIGWAATLDAHCEVYQRKNIDFLFIHQTVETYCCKDCCFTTISKDCSDSKCMNTCQRSRGEDSNECFISKAFGGETTTEGCDTDEYCQFVGKSNSSYGEYECEAKINNGASCSSNDQCISGKCSRWINRQERCYYCVPDLTPGPLFGRETTHYCNNNTQFCSNETLDCSAKVEAGESCQGNNFMCSSNLCDKSTDKCIECSNSIPCDHETQKCIDGVCHQIQVFAGSPCIDNDDCHSGNCTERVCRAQGANGTYCNNKFECASGICEYHSCGFSDYKKIPGFNSTINTSNGGNPGQESSTSPFIYIGIGAFLVLALALGFFFLCRKKDKGPSVDDLVPEDQFPTMKTRAINQSSLNGSWNYTPMGGSS